MKKFFSLVLSFFIGLKNKFKKSAKKRFFYKNYPYKKHYERFEVGDVVGWNLQNKEVKDAFVRQFGNGPFKILKKRSNISRRHELRYKDGTFVLDENGKYIFVSPEMLTVKPIKGKGCEFDIFEEIMDYA
jgi:hypothetical protein